MKSAWSGIPMVGACLALSAGIAWSLDLPAGPLESLKSEEFRQREDGQAQLLAWAQKQGEPAMDALWRGSRVADDPEVRERCLAVLKDLVGEEYLKDGEGYIGIRMQDELANVPGDPKPRGVIRVLQVMADSAAAQAGLQANDLIVSLGDVVWHETGISESFRNKIRQLKPKALVMLKVLRGGKLMEMELRLGRRPAMADVPFLNESQVDVEAAERQAKDAYFRRWMERRKLHP